MTGLYTMVASTALALFLPQANLTALGFRAARVDLEISLESGGGSGYASQQSLTIPEYLHPDGTEYSQLFWIKNVSSNGQDMILTGQMLAGVFDWDRISQVVELNITHTGMETGWYTLADWASSPIEIPGGVMQPGQSRKYGFSYRMMTHYAVDPDGPGPLQAGDEIGDELEGAMTENVTFQIDGDLQ